jgi:hypothetical protein
MKWFKHDSYASNDPKLEKLRIRHGVEGYGLYFYCLELIAREISSKKYTFELEHDSELIAFNLKMDSKKVEEILLYCVNQNLFQITESNVITCFNMLKRLDDSTTKSPQIKELIKNTVVARKNSEKLRKTPSRIEENRKEKKRIEEKIALGPNENVMLTQSQMDRIAEEYNIRNNSKRKAMVDKVLSNLSAYIVEHPNKYKNHYLTLRNWINREEENK